MTNFLGSEHIFHVYRVHPQDDGSVKRQFIGRFIEHDGEVHVLEDHFGVLAGIPDGPVTPRTNAIIDKLRRSSYLDIVTSDDIEKGHHPDLIPARNFAEERAQAAAQPAPEPPQKDRRPSVFEYERDGQSHTVEFRDGQCFLDGQHLDNAEAARLLQHHRQGFAVLRYQKKGNG